MRGESDPEEKRMLPTTTRRSTLICGIDGSDAAATAARFGVRLAATLGLRPVIAHAVAEPLGHAPAARRRQREAIELGME
jgi:hypothetical protein